MVAFFCPPPFWATGRGPSSLIDRTAGTNIGNMTWGGGLAASFDGVTNQGGANSSMRQSGGNAYIGKTFVAPTAIDFVNVYGANDHGYVVNNPSVTLNLRGKNGSAPSGTSDGDLIGTTGEFTDTATTNPKTIDCIDKNTLYDHVFVEIVNGTGNNTRMAEVEIWGWQ